MFELLIVAGVVVMALAFFTFEHVVMRKLGGMCILTASFLTGWLSSGRIWVGALLALLWFFMPWLEILTRVRKLRLPLDNKLAHRHPPSRDAFPALPHLTDEIETEMFEFVEDTGWDWNDVRQFMRVFYHEKMRAQALISLNEQSMASVAYIALVSRTDDGMKWMTWNYPFPPMMKFAPDLRINPRKNARTFEELLVQHEGFLLLKGVGDHNLEVLDPEEFEQLIQRESRRQIDHNLDEGLIKLAGDGTFRYSWRGFFFLWRQFLKDMVRFS